MCVEEPGKCKTRRFNLSKGGTAFLFTGCIPPRMDHRPNHVERFQQAAPASTESILYFSFVSNADKEKALIGAIDLKRDIGVTTCEGDHEQLKIEVRGVLRKYNVKIHQEGGELLEKAITNAEDLTKDRLIELDEIIQKTGKESWPASSGE